ncbi:MAG TPA: PfkB family carbohydrate kinase [Candidatus Obscuribacterales bacterium]
MAVVTIGEVVVDWISTTIGADFLTARDFVRSLGGNASNVAIGLCRLGTAASLIGKRGDDSHGRFLLDILSREGVDLSYLFVDNEYPTAQCYVFRHANEEHTFHNWPRPNASHRLVADEITKEQFEGASFLHATGISLTMAPRRFAVIKAMEIARALAVPVSFDAGFPTGEDEEARRFSLTALSLATLVKVNLSELKFWAESLSDVDKTLPKAEAASDPKDRRILEDDEGSGVAFKAIDRASGEPLAWVTEYARALTASLERPLLVVTLGPHGSLICMKDGAIAYCPGSKVEAHSELGAGDAFVAGLIHALVSRADGKQTLQVIDRMSAESWMEVLSYANAVGALSTSAMTAWEAMPSHLEVEKLLKSGATR